MLHGPIEACSHLNSVVSSSLLFVCNNATLYMYKFLRDVIFKVLVVNWSSVRNSSSVGIFKEKDTLEWLHLTLVRYDDKFLRQPLAACRCCGGHCLRVEPQYWIVIYPGAI